MSPKDFIVNALHAALDNAHDMRMASQWGSEAGDEISAEQYAISTIVNDICNGPGKEMPECGYLDWQYSEERGYEVRFPVQELQPHLTEALITFLSSL